MKSTKIRPPHSRARSTPHRHPPRSVGSVCAIITPPQGVRGREFTKTPGTQVETSGRARSRHGRRALKSCFFPTKKSPLGDAQATGRAQRGCLPCSPERAASCTSGLGRSRPVSAGRGRSGRSGPDLCGRRAGRGRGAPPQTEPRGARGRKRPGDPRAAGPPGHGPSTAGHPGGATVRLCSARGRSVGRCTAGCLERDFKSGTAES